MSNRHTKHKIRPRLLTFVMSIFLVLSMIMPMINYSTLEAHAAGGDMESEDDGKATGTYEGGPMMERTGWLFYCINLDNAQVTTTVACTSAGSIVDRNGKALPASNILLTSRYGITAADYQIGCAWGPPYDRDCNGLGDEVRDHMLETAPNGQKVAYNLISDAFGHEYAEQWNAREVYLVFEPFYWYNVLRKDGEKQLGYYCMTSYLWGEFHQKLGCPETGTSAFKKYTNKVWPTCVKLDGSAETAALGFTPISGAQTNSAMATFSNGAGIGILWNGDVDSSQTTCDEPKQPDPHKPPEESVGPYKIVKSYRIKNLDTGALTDKGTFVKEDSSPKIKIEDESEYKLVEWRTSTTYDKNILSTVWEKTVPATVKQSGKNPTTIEMKTPETTLYLLLEKPEKDTVISGKADFIISQSTITRKIKISQPDNAGLNILKDVTFRWERPAHKNSCSGHTHDTGECSGCKDTNGDGIKDDCDGHSHTVYCTWGKWNDNHTKLSLKNSKKSNYPDILATKAGWESITTTGLSAYTKRSKEHSSGHLVGADYWNYDSWDYSCVLLRGKDKLTVASWKNTDLGTEEANEKLAGVSDSGFSIGNSATGNRKKSLYYDNFTFTIADDSPDLVTKREPTTKISCHDDDGCDIDSQTFSLKTAFSVDVGVKVETYSGTASSGVNDKSCISKPSEYGVFSGLSDLTGFTRLNKVRGMEVQSISGGGSISFYPYVQMNYDVQAATHEKYGNAAIRNGYTNKTAYVLGDIQREMTPNDYAEISWRQSDKPNLTLNSLQWSTHSSAMDFIADDIDHNGVGKGLDVQEFKVLPGGATLSLTIRHDDRDHYDKNKGKDDCQRVQVTTYQCVIEGSGKTQIDNTGGSDGGLTPAAAEEAHKKYADSVKNALEQLNVEQWVTNDLSKVNAANAGKSTMDVWNNDGEAIQPGSNLFVAGHPKQTASTEEKYYFRDDGTLPNASAGEGDLDARYIDLSTKKPTDDITKATFTKKYTFFTNTKGEVRYTVNDVNPNVGSEDKGKLANDTIANQINSRTHVIEKLQKAVEQGTGNDPSGRSKTGTAWYNEAFDGITVYVQTTELSVGYTDPPQRSVVLDPKLTQTQGEEKSDGTTIGGQKDMFNPDKYNMSQYRTKEYSHKYNGDTDRIGEFKNTAVYMKDMKNLFFSRQFFIPNCTVDDLH